MGIVLRADKAAWHRLAWSGTAFFELESSADCGTWSELPRGINVENIALSADAPALDAPMFAARRRRACPSATPLERKVSFSQKAIGTP